MMNKYFSLRRTGLLVRSDFLEYRRFILYYALITVVTLVFFFGLMVQGSRPPEVFYFGFLYSTGIFTTFLFMCAVLHKHLNRSDGVYLVTPATVTEKYISSLLEFIGAACIFTGLFYLSMALWNVLFYKQIQSVFFTGAAMNGGQGWAMLSRGDWIFASVFSKEFSFFLCCSPVRAFLTVLFIGGAVTFRKHAVLLTGLLFFSVLLVLTFTSYEYLEYYFRDYFYRPQYSRGVILLNRYQGIDRLALYLPYLFLLFTLYALYIIYLKFKDKEVK